MNETLTTVERWLLDFMEAHCKGLVNAKPRHEIHAAMLAAGHQVSDSVFRVAKERVIEKGYLICSQQEAGYWRPINWAEVLLDTRAKWMLIADLKHKAILMEKVAAEVFGPQTTLPGMPPAAGEAAPKGYGVP